MVPTKRSGSHPPRDLNKHTTGVGRRGSSGWPSASAGAPTAAEAPHRQPSATIRARTPRVTDEPDYGVTR
jgi:hypothetical protein